MDLTDLGNLIDLKESLDENYSQFILKSHELRNVISSIDADYTVCFFKHTIKFHHLYEILQTIADNIIMLSWRKWLKMLDWFSMVSYTCVDILEIVKAEKYNRSFRAPDCN